MLAGYQADYVPATSPAELGEWSDLVVTANLVDIIDGREHGRNPTDPSLALTVTMVVDVDEVLKGKAADHVFIEMPSPGNTPASAYKDVGEGLKVVVYAVPAQHEPDIIIDAGAGRPRGEALYQLTTPQGLIASDGSAVAQVLEFETYPGAKLYEFYPDRTQYPDNGDDPEGS